MARFGGIKMSVDGACVWKNAAVYEPYPGEPDNCGIVRIPQDELDEKVALCHAQRTAGCHPRHRPDGRSTWRSRRSTRRSTSTPGRATATASSTPTCRAAGQLERMARLGIIASTAAVVRLGLRRWLVQRLGRENLPHVMPLRTMLDLGMRVHGQHRFPLRAGQPFLGSSSAVTRLTRDGCHSTRARRSRLGEALRLQTTSSAYAGFEEHRKGSLELAKLADLVIISEDPYAVPPEELDRIQVETTIANGEVVFERASTPATV